MQMKVDAAMKDPNGSAVPSAAKVPEREKKQEPVRKGETIGRNDPCPCGSGKKYKKCCGANLNDGE